MFRHRSTSSLAILGLFLVMLSSEAIAQLGPASYRSLEDMVHNSEVVLLGRIIAIDGEREQLGQTTYKIRFNVEEAIKGGDLDHNDFYLFAKRDQIEKWINTRARLVLKSPFDINTNSESAWIMIDFTEPLLMQLSLGEDGVLTHVDTEKEVLEVLRNTVQRLPGVVQMRTFQLPTELRLVKQANLLIQDGLPIVFVPIDKPLETWARRVISGDTDLSLDSGVRALRHFKSEANIEWMRLLIETETDDENRRVLKGLLDEWNTPAGSPRLHSLVDDNERPKKLSATMDIPF